MRVLFITVLVLVAVSTSFILGVYVGAQTAGNRSAQDAGEEGEATAKASSAAGQASRTGADATALNGAARDTAAGGQAGDAAGEAAGGASGPSSASTGNGARRSETRRADGPDDRPGDGNGSDGDAASHGEDATDLPARIVGILEAFRGQAGRSAGGTVAGAGGNEDDGASSGPGGLKSLSRAYAVQTRAALSRPQGEAVARALRRVAEEVSLVETRDGRVFVRTSGFADRPSARAAVSELARTTSVPLDVVRVTGAPRAASSETTARAGAGG